MTTTIGWLAMLVTLACGAPAHAQLVSGLSGLAGLAEINAAITAATPPECPAPMPDALTATAGTAPNCMTRPDARRATQVQPVATVTLADGTFTASWPATWPGGAPTTVLAVARSTATPYICQVGTATADSFTGKCFELFATTLGGTLTAIVGTVISPFKNAAAGVVVNVVGDSDMEISVLSLPATFAFDANGFYVTATFQRVRIADSPLVFHFDPPIASIDQIGYPAIEAFLIDALRGGAVIL